MQVRRLLHLRFDELAQALVAREAEPIISALAGVLVAFAPAHQFIAAETRIGVQDNPSLWPALANLGDDALREPPYRTPMAVLEAVLRPLLRILHAKPPRAHGPGAGSVRRRQLHRSPSRHPDRR
jgi:hypothetical protein